MNTPIEVWLTQANMQVTCRAVHEDESVEEWDIDSLSMRGAQREITGYLIAKGYQPDGRWTQADNDGAETWRRFKKEAEALTDDSCWLVEVVIDHTERVVEDVVSIGPFANELVAAEWGFAHETPFGTHPHAYRSTIVGGVSTMTPEEAERAARA